MSDLLPPVIMCAQCRRPVERFETSYLDHDRTHRFVVWCHGERDEARVPAEVFYDGGQIVRAEAFTTKKLVSA